MTWHIFITRVPGAATVNGGIGMAEWRSAALSDPSLDVLPTAGGADVAPVVLWRREGRPASMPGTAICLQWNYGSIAAASPDDATICKMWDIANSLGARIEDDDGGGYDRNAILITDDEYDVAYA